MKRLIALLIAILTMLFGGVRSAEEQPVADTVPKETETMRFVVAVTEDTAETTPAIKKPTVETDLPSEPSLETEQTEGLSTEKKNVNR